MESWNNRPTAHKKVFRECKRRHNNLATAQTDYKKAYGMAPHNWINLCLEMFGIAKNVQDVLNNCMKSWKIEMNVSGKTLGEADIRREIFQGNRIVYLHCCLFCVWSHCHDC